MKYFLLTKLNYISIF